MFYSYFSCFLINTADRVIRVYDSKEILACGKDGEPEPMQKLQDLVNKLVYCICLKSSLLKVDDEFLLLSKIKIWRID